MKDRRKLQDLVSVGPATLGDFHRVGISDMATLAKADPDALYEALCVADGLRHDICARDVFAAAIAQARDPGLPAEQRNWWYWSRRRKAGRP